MLHVIEIRKESVSNTLLNRIRNYTGNIVKVKSLIKPEVLSALDINVPGTFVKATLDTYWNIKPKFQMQELTHTVPGRNTTVQFITDDDNNRLVVFVDSKIVNDKEKFEIYLGYDSTLSFQNRLVQGLGLKTTDWRFAV